MPLSTMYLVLDNFGSEADGFRRLKLTSGTIRLLFGRKQSLVALMYLNTLPYSHSYMEISCHSTFKCFRAAFPAALDQLLTPRASMKPRNYCPSAALTEGLSLSLDRAPCHCRCSLLSSVLAITGHIHHSIIWYLNGTLCLSALKNMVLAVNIGVLKQGAVRVGGWVFRLRDNPGQLAVWLLWFSCLLACCSLS